MDLLSDNDDVDENMSVDQSELHNVENTAAIQIRKEPEKLLTKSNQTRSLLESICNDETSSIQGANQNNERSNEHFTSNTMEVAEQDQALDLSKTSIMSPPKSNLSSEILGYDANLKASSSGSPIAVNSKSEKEKLI